jgi:hypothetical protein
MSESPELPDSPPPRDPPGPEVPDQPLGPAEPGIASPQEEEAIPGLPDSEPPDAG